MESVLSTNDKQTMISSFLEIAVGQTTDTARQFLQATSWKLDEAIQLFYVGNEIGATTQVLPSSSVNGGNSVADEPAGGEPRTDGGVGNSPIIDADEVRAPLPVKREVLYEDAVLYPGSGMGYPSRGPASVVAFRNFDEEMKHPGVWESEQGATSTAENPRDNLASLYRPPFHLMFRGSFEKAKAAASMQDKWLVVNLQSTREFSSHMLNRDTWANEAVSQTISTNFIFWQVYDDTSEGQKVCTYYKLDSIPVVLIIDPITGQKMRSWCGMIQPESLLEDLLPFMDGGPKDHHVTLSHKRPRERSLTPPQKFKDESKEEDAELEAALAASLGDVKDPIVIAPSQGNTGSKEEEEASSSSSPIKKPEYPPLPEEPKGDRSLVCRVGVRLPDGRRVQRNFLKSDSVQLLWSFCYSQLEDKNKVFRLTQAIPGASKILDYDSNLTFDESGLANSMISVTWE